MSSPSRKLFWALLGVAFALAALGSTLAVESALGAPNSPAGAAESLRTLHVAADPNNLPFSNQRQEGFENRLAQILGDELHCKIEYTWWAQRRGFFRNTLKDGDCDLVLGVPRGMPRLLTTSPYYHSTYVFVSRRDRGLDIHSFDDPRLRTLKIGEQMIGNDATNSPPAHALSARHIIDNIVGYTLYGDYREENPPARIVRAVESGEVDLAVVWGPLAGYFAKQSKIPLALNAVTPESESPALTYAFDICVGVRKTEPKLRDEVEAALNKRRAEIEHLLDEYGIPHSPIGAQVAVSTP